MSELSYVHRMNTPSSNNGMPPSHAAKQHQGSDARAQHMLQELMSTNARVEERTNQLETKLRAAEERLEARAREHESQLSRTTDEARRWKQAHDNLHMSARELAYKTTVGESKLKDAQTRHSHLQENHAAMQAKYQSLKKLTKELQAEKENHTTKVESDWQAHATKWKQRCQDAVDKYEALVKETLNNASKHAAGIRSTKDGESKVLSDLRARIQTLQSLHKDSTKRETELNAKAQAARKDYAQREAELNANAQGMRQEYAQLKADHKVSCGDNARFHTELSRAKLATEALTRENAHLSLRVQQAAQDKSELAALRLEMPAVKAQLSKVKSLTNQVGSLTVSNQKLATSMEELQLAQIAAQAKHKRAMATTLDEQRTTSATELAATKVRMQATIDSTAECLHTAKKALSDNAVRDQQLIKTAQGARQQQAAALRNCRHMLEKSHEVMSVYTAVHAKSDLPDSPLFEALSTATSTIGKFLQTPLPL